MCRPNPEAPASPDELSNYFGRNRETVTRLAVAGSIPSFRFGRHCPFDPVAALDATRAIKAQTSDKGRHE